LFIHDVNGKIAQISKHPDQLSPPNVPGKSYFSILYQEIDGEHMKHVARVYYLGKSSNKSSIIPGVGHTETIEYRAFDYKDLVLPGTTWISAFSLEDGMLLYARYEFACSCKSILGYEGLHIIISETQIAITFEPFHYQPICIRLRFQTKIKDWL
jgi:hypothetical protein